MNKNIAGVDIPDGALARAAFEHVRGVEPELLLHHALRVFLFAALIGCKEALAFDTELLYVGALFHNVGLNERYRRSRNRFEIDSANAAREFLRSHRADESATAQVWTAIALHTTPGIPEHMSPLVALVSAGVQMDVRGTRFHEFTAQQRDAIVHAFPRERGFKTKLIEMYACGLEHRPETTFGTVNADVLDRWDPDYRRLNFCGLVLGSEWPN
ncbi:HD domain-containing protein [Paraburkholderia terrae]|uniref:HD domain-containing protein n=1 Tax=Paraburkholderia terrae TaxID=311230 RepID=UPI001EE34587|nr:HD domain-containing protein [Paraburkholderia terrae]GJH05385.1 HD domain-containing protein [Paraburkholderia terrae]